MEKGDELLRHVKEKESRHFPTYRIILFCHPQILQTFFFFFFVERSSGQLLFGRPFLYMAQFLPLGVALDPDLANQNTGDYYIARRLD